MNNELLMLFDEIEKQKGISRSVILDALENALISAYKRNYGTSDNAGVRIDVDSGTIKVFAQKTVVEEVDFPDCEISLEDALDISKQYKIGDIVECEVTPRNFGRIAAQTARQVVLQRIREAEREKIFDEFAGKTNDIVSGIVRRVDRKNVIIEIGDTESALSPSEQIPSDRYIPGQRLKVYVVEVVNSVKGVHMSVSRSHPGLVRKLFELEIPEIEAGIIEIKALSREAGSRTKMAVYSNDPNIDAIGTCIGPRGMRVQKVLDELNGEKIDIIRYNEDAAQFIMQALSPARVLSIDADEANRICRVTVPHDQLSLAIGKEGQNVRLAARLTNYKIDIKSESQEAE